jgi:hypothetical protein
MQDSGSAVSSYIAQKPDSIAAGFVSGCAQNYNTENDNTEFDKISVMNGIEVGDHINIMIENRGLSTDTGTQWLPHTGITGLGNLDHPASGVDIDKVNFDNDWLVFGGSYNLQADNPKNYTPMNEIIHDLDNHDYSQEVLSDLENHEGMTWRSSFPPPYMPDNVAQIHNYGFIPLSEVEVYQGPMSLAAVESLLGIRELHGDPGVHNRYFVFLQNTGEIRI